MMNAKKWMACMLAAALAGTLLSGCGKSANNATGIGKVNVHESGYPIVDEKTTLTAVAVIGDGEFASKESVIQQALEKQTNVHVEFEDVSNAAWQEKKGLRMSGKDLPDVLIGVNLFNDKDILDYSSQGIIIPLDELAKKYAPNFMHLLETDPELKKQLTAEDGHIYALPNYDKGFTPSTYEVLYINKAWLDKLNLEVPETYDELYEVLKAFKTQDPNGNGKADEIPLSFVKNAYAAPWFYSFGAYDETNTYAKHISLKNGKVVYAPIQPEYKEAIKYFNKLFAEGLVDQEAFTQDSAMFNAKLKAYPERQVGMFTAWRSTSWKNANQTEDDYIAIAPLKGPSGKQIWPEMDRGVTGRAAFVITSSCKNPELALRWADTFYEEEYSIQTNLKLQMGNHVKKNDNGKYEIVKAYNVDDPNEPKIKNGSMFWAMTPEITEKFVEEPPHMKEKFELDKIYENFHPEKEAHYPNVFFTNEETARLADFSVDINTYVEGRYAHWMVNGGIDEEWDSYIEKLNNMKLDEMLKIYQDAYDRYESVK